MKGRKARKFLSLPLTMLVVFGALPANGQIEEPLNMVMEPVGIGARALGLGGAYAAVANDYTALYWNPAGLALIRKMEFNLAMSHSKHRDEATAVGRTVDDQMTRTRLNTLGFVLPVPTYRGSLVFAFGYHRPKTFDNSFAFEWFNNTSGDSVTQRWNEFEEGYLSVWSFGGAIDLSPNLSVGASLNFWGGTNDYQWSFREYDSRNLYTFNDYVSDFTIGTSIKATELRLGALYRFGRLIRLGATVTLPRTFRFSEDWDQSEKTTFDDNSQDVSTDGGHSEYKVTFPFSFSAAASVELLNIMVTGEIVQSDWSQIEYATDPPFANVTRAEANLYIHDNYRPTTKVKLGGEFTLPATGLQLRAGIAHVPSPLRNATSDQDRTYYSLGFSALLDKQLKLDIAWVRGTWSRITPSFSESPDVRNVEEKIRRDLVLATLAFRF